MKRRLIFLFLTFVMTCVHAKPTCPSLVPGFPLVERSEKPVKPMRGYDVSIGGGWFVPPEELDHIVGATVWGPERLLTTDYRCVWICRWQNECNQPQIAMYLGPDWDELIRDAPHFATKHDYLHYCSSTFHP